MFQLMTNPATGGFDTQAQGVLYGQPANFAGVLGGNYNAYTQGLASLGNAYTGAYGAYGRGIGDIATARGNEASARYGANALAEAARQSAVGSIGSSALGAYGSASNAALAAWGANQQAYNQAAASMHNANQQGISQYGQSRNAALGNLGGAYAGMGRAQIGASALSGLGMQGGATGFQANGPNGPVASGSYSGGGTRGGLGGGAAGQQAYQGLNSVQGNIMAPDVLAHLNDGALAGRQQLDAQHYTSRGMPSQMLGQSLSGLLTLGKDAYGNANAGMNQFYANNQMNEAPYQDFTGMLTSGFGTVGNQLNGVQGAMTSGFNTANQGVNNMWTDSLGKLPGWRPQQQQPKPRQPSGLPQLTIQSKPSVRYV